MKRMSAFTLIELLVVIAIISLLVSILLPSLQRAKDLAIRTACRAHLKSMGTAHHFYADDHDDRLVAPAAFHPASTGGNWRDDFPWLNVIVTGGYAEWNSAFFCPAEETYSVEYYEQRWPSGKGYITYCYVGGGFRINARSGVYYGPSSLVDSYGSVLMCDLMTMILENGVYGGSHIESMRPGGPAGGNVMHLGTSVIWKDPSELNGEHRRFSATSWDVEYFW